MSFYLVLVSPLDAPLFELTFQTSRPIPSTPQQASSSYPSWSTFASSSGADLTGSKTAVAAVTGQGQSQGQVGDRHLMQMVAHAALDVVEDVMVGTGSLYHKTIDRYNEWMVSAFVAPCVKLLLLHDLKNEDGIRMFFLDVWEAYTKSLLNPFHTSNTPIRNPAFDARIRASAKRYL